MSTRGGLACVMWHYYFYKIIGSTLHSHGNPNKFIYAIRRGDRAWLLCLLELYFLESMERTLDLDLKMEDEMPKNTKGFCLNPSRRTLGEREWKGSIDQPSFQGKASVYLPFARRWMNQRSPQSTGLLDSFYAISSHVILYPSTFPKYFPKILHQTP